MIKSKSIVQKIILGSTLCLALFISYSYRINSQPVSSNSNTQNAKKLRFVRPKPPNQGAPHGRGRGGATRGECLKYKELTALVPSTEEVVWGLTVADRPTFWFFIPETLTTKFSVKFMLVDEEDNYIYKTSLNTETQPGIVSVSVPSNAQPLEIDKSYYWTFSIDCDPEDPLTFVFVQGSLQRVAIDSVVQGKLDSATPLEKVAVYAENSIWHEALTELAALRLAKPNDTSVATAWGELLREVELEAIANEPIVTCCTPQK